MGIHGWYRHKVLIHQAVLTIKSGYLVIARFFTHKKTQALPSAVLPYGQNHINPQTIKLG
jgi:hypothetical protein